MYSNLLGKNIVYLASDGKERYGKLIQINHEYGTAIIRGEGNYNPRSPYQYNASLADLKNNCRIIAD